VWPFLFKRRGTDEHLRSGFEKHREAMRRRRPTAGGPERQRGPSNPQRADCEQSRRLHQINEEATLAVAFSFVGEGGADENPRSGFEEHRGAMRRRRPPGGNANARR